MARDHIDANWLQGDLAGNEKCCECFMYLFIKPKGVGSHKGSNGKVPSGFCRWSWELRTVCWRYTEHQRAYGAPSLSGSLPTDCFFGVFFSFVLFLILEAVFFFVWLISLH